MAHSSRGVGETRRGSLDRAGRRRRRGSVDMAFSKLLQQFTHGRPAPDESASAQQVDKEVMTSQPDAGLDSAAAAPTGDAEPEKPKGPLNPIEIGIMEEEVIEAIRTCYDPEIP